MGDSLILSDLSEKRTTITKDRMKSSRRRSTKSKKWLNKMKKKQCINFILAKEKVVEKDSGEKETQYICKCGYTKMEHIETPLIDVKENDNNVDMEEVPTDAQGVIDFKGSTRRSAALFIRTSDSIRVKDLYDYIKGVWQVDTPRLLISVTGGAKSFNMKPELKKLFSKGLVKVASTPGAWVLTGGTNTGVMKHVGEALEGASDKLIGMATWGIVTNRKQLTDEKIEAGEKHSYVVSSSLISKGAFLDANHTHFILVDDGTNGQFGKEIKLRAKLENYIMTEATKNSDFSGGIVPSVVLVVEGGPGTLGTVNAALTGDPPVPVVIIKDSGRAADCIAEALNIMEGQDLDQPDEDNKQELIDLIKTTFPELNTEQKKQNAYHQVINCLRQSNAITVFDMSTGSGLDEAILTSLLHVGSNTSYALKINHVHQLRLTILWDRPDLAEEKILSQNLADGWKEKDLHDAMIMALALDRVGFVQLLLRYGVNMVDVIKSTQLEFLYGYRHKLEEGFFEAKFTDKNIDEDVFNLLCGYNGWNARECFISLDTVYNWVKKLCNKLRKNGHEEFMEGQQNSTRGLIIHTSNAEVKYPFRELFTWAVLNRMHNMAMYLWEFGEAGMTKAIVASHICRELSTFAANKDAKELEDEYLNNAGKFEELALQLLDQCSRTSESISQKLITVEFEQFPGITTLSLAVSSDQQKFLSNTLVQVLLNNVWTGAIRQREVSARECLFGIFFPPYILTFDFVTENTLKEMIHAEDETVEDEDVQEQTDKNKNENENEGSTSGEQTIKSAMNKQKKYQATQQPSIEYYPEDINQKELSTLSKLSEFWKAPVTKFYSNVLAYFIFLGMISYVALKSKVNENGELDTTPSIIEWINFVFVISLTIDEIRQLVSSEGHSFFAKFKDWANSFWNLIDLCAIVLFYVAFVLRFYSQHLSKGQTVYAFDAGLWVLRLLDVFHAHRKLGPYVYMIGKMCVEMLYFLAILVVFMVAYGVSVTALLKPQADSWDMLRDILFHPYFNIYGELFLGDGSATETLFGTDKINNYGESLAFLLLGIYLLIANVLLLNLLIAIFGNTFADVQIKSDDIWKFERYHLIKEYANRPLLVPPFILIVHVYMVILFIIEKCKFRQQKQGRTRLINVGELKSKVTEEDKDMLIQFEVTAIARLLRNKRKAIEDVEAEE